MLFVVTMANVCRLMNFAMLLFHAVMEVTSLMVHVEREIKVEWLLNFVHLNAKMEDADRSKRNSKYYFTVSLTLRLNLELQTNDKLKFVRN